MSKQIPSSRFIVSPFGTEQAGFYQDLLRGLSSYEQLANRLIRLAEHAHAFRQFDQLKEIGEILSNFPIKSYQAIGHYYIGIFYNNCGNGDLEKAKGLLTLAADAAPPYYRGKAILSLAAVSAHLKQPDAELYYFTEALNQTLKDARGMAIGLAAYQGIAIHKAKQGHHRHALKDLENILPLIKYALAPTYFDILNSYAVELGEAGRKDEARNIMRVVLASPLIRAYPVWRETARELKPANRSFVTIGSLSYNVLTLPEREPSEQPTIRLKPAQVLDLAKWKKKMAKKRKDEPDEPDENIDAMDRSDLIVRLLEMINKEDIDEAKLRKIVRFAEGTLTRRKPPDTPAS